jgi:predicted transposase YdaD
MNEYDIALKNVLQRQLRGSVFADWLGFTVTEWLSTEIPTVSMGSADLLGRTVEGGLLHIELQSTNDPDMALRMAEYKLGFFRQHRRYAKQIVLYVGARPLRMKPAMPADPDSSFRCQIVDIREVSAEPLLASDLLEDNILSILARLSGERETVRRVLRRIAGAPPEQRRLALNELTILAGLRDFGGIINKERQTMPILDNIMDHDLLGPILRKGLQQGIEQGLEQGRVQGLEQGRVQGERRVVLGQIRRRFGDLAPRFAARLEAMDSEQLESISLRLFDAQTVEELFA